MIGTQTPVCSPQLTVSIGPPYSPSLQILLKVFKKYKSPTICSLFLKALLMLIYPLMFLPRSLQEAIVNEDCQNAIKDGMDTLE